MKDEYKKHIVSTDEHQVWLHRTSKDLVDKIMREGLLFIDLTSTATLQPKNLKEAEQVYQRTHGGRQATIVVKIPQEIARKYYLNRADSRGPRHEGYSSDTDVSYWHPEGKYAIQRQHIHGYIDRETNEYHENPYRNQPQKLTDKHFPPTIYGGLEKDLVEPDKPVVKEKSRRVKRLKRGELPPPPTEFDILG